MPDPARAVAGLEQQVPETPVAGIVLRYGRLHGSGTGMAATPLHAGAAADAARRIHNAAAITQR